MRNKGKIIAILLISIMVAVMFISCDDDLINPLNLGDDDLQVFSMELFGSYIYAAHGTGDDPADPFDFKRTLTLGDEYEAAIGHDDGKLIYIRKGTKVIIDASNDGDEIATIKIEASHIQGIRGKATLI